jgi:hypothetical protein
LWTFACHKQQGCERDSQSTRSFHVTTPLRSPCSVASSIAVGPWSIQSCHPDDRAAVSPSARGRQIGALPVSGVRSQDGVWLRTGRGDAVINFRPQLASTSSPEGPCQESASAQFRKYESTSPITTAGHPHAFFRAGMSLSTKDIAPTTAESPIVTPLQMMLFGPM